MCLFFLCQVLVLPLSNPYLVFFCCYSPYLVFGLQVGFALVNDKGELPPSGDVWQFNFQFSLQDDMYSLESVEMLRTAGIDFTRLAVSFSAIFSCVNAFIH